MFLIRFINRERNHSALFVEFKKKRVESVIKHNYGAKAQKEYIVVGQVISHLCKKQHFTGD